MMKLKFKHLPELKLKYQTLIELEQMYIDKQKDLLNNNKITYTLTETNMFLIEEPFQYHLIHNTLIKNQRLFEKELKKVLRRFNWHRNIFGIWYVKFWKLLNK